LATDTTMALLNVPRVTEHDAALRGGREIPARLDENAVLGAKGELFFTGEMNLRGQFRMLGGRR